MSNVNDIRGSIWRKWDLHIHTPGGKIANGYGTANSDEAWNAFIDALEASDVQAFGITDYFGGDVFFHTVERYRVRHPDSSKVFFPNIELRGSSKNRNFLALRIGRGF